jgi:hypothetical protein
VPSLRGKERLGAVIARSVSDEAIQQARAEKPYQKGSTLDCFVATRNDEEGCGMR